MNLIPFYQDVISWNSFVGNDINNSKLKDLYVNLVLEESTEIFDSIKDNDPIEFIDGVCDSLVVGSFLMALKRKEDFKNHKVAIENVELDTSIMALNDLVKNDTLNNIEKIIDLLEKLSSTIEVDIIKACEEVMFSNWSKFPLISEVNPNKEVSFIENQGRYTNISFESKLDNSGNERFVFKDGNGKVVKPSTFKDPALKEFITKSFANLDIFK